MSNFTFLQSTPAFAPFATVAVAAEKILPIDPSAAVINCRRAMEFAVKWMYSVDGSLVLPYDDRLASLMDNEDFRDVVGPDVWQRMKLIRLLGNQAAHNSRNITREQAALCLENLHCFLDFVAYCYADTYEPQVFDPALLDAPAQPAPVVDNTTEEELSAWLALVRSLRPREVMIYTIDRETPARELEKAPLGVLHDIARRVGELGIQTTVAG